MGWKMKMLEAGYELDKAVAEACGIEHTAYDFRHDASGIVWVPTIPEDNKTARPFRPSSDWNDAMFAAEKCGLFKNWLMGQAHPAITIGSTWYFQDYSERPMGVESKSGPVAICLAILKLKGVE